MTERERRFVEDRALRDAALALFKADIALVRASLAERGIGKRIGDRVGEATLEVIDEAVDMAQENKFTVGAALAAIILWFARGPILDALGLRDDEEPADDTNSSGDD